ncbi:MAG TPA: acyl carrier protein [Ktedonobacteraceae bacterium]
MQRTEIVAQLKKYIAQDVLSGKDIGLDETTPLLEWGVINSLELVRLLNFIHTTFAVEIPMSKLTPDKLTNLSSISNLVIESAGSNS